MLADGKAVEVGAIGQRPKARFGAAGGSVILLNEIRQFGVRGAHFSVYGFEKRIAQSFLIGLGDGCREVVDGTTENVGFAGGLRDGANL